MRSALCWIGATTLISLIVYDIKYNVHQAQKETRKLEAQLISERKALHMLELEWTYMTRPARIAKLSQTHLALSPIAPAQLVSDQAMRKPSGTGHPAAQPASFLENAP